MGVGEERRVKGERIFPFPYRAFLPLPSPLFMRLPHRLSTAVNDFRNVTPFAI